MPERRGSTPTFILKRFKRPLGAPRVAGSYDSEGCLRAVWNDETQSFEIVLEFWSDRSAYLENLRDIFFDGIPSQPIMQRPVQEALRPGLWILNHSQLDSSPYYCLQFKEKSVRDACALFKPFMQIGAAEADAALAYLDAKDAQNTGAAERALLELMNLNVGGQFQPLLARQLPSQQEFDAWTDQQARMYVAAYFDHAGTAHLKQTLLANQLFDAQLKVVLTAENSSERARTHLRRLRDRMRLGQLASDGLVLTIETAEDVEAFWRDIVQPHSVLNLQRYQYFYHMLLRGRVRGTFDCCQKGS